MHTLLAVQKLREYSFKIHNYAADFDSLTTQYHCFISSNLFPTAGGSGATAQLRSRGAHRDQWRLHPKAAPDQRRSWESPGCWEARRLHAARDAAVIRQFRHHRTRHRSRYTILSGFGNVDLYNFVCFITSSQGLAIHYYIVELVVSTLCAGSLPCSRCELKIFGNF